MQELPREVLTFIEEYHKMAMPNGSCGDCSSSCCAHSGFAILENVEAIYEKYRQGELKREDYTFPPGMNLPRFVFSYFDILTCFVGPDKTDSIVQFFPKHLSCDGSLVIIPIYEKGYYKSRVEFFEENSKAEGGCIFLSRRLSGGDGADGTRHCILHEKNTYTNMSSKPIDCLFYTCNYKKRGKNPTHEQTEQWFLLLARQYPASAQRFQQIIDENGFSGGSQSLTSKYAYKCIAVVSQWPKGFQLKGVYLGNEEDAGKKQVKTEQFDFAVRGNIIAPTQNAAVNDLVRILTTNGFGTVLSAEILNPSGDILEDQEAFDEAEQLEMLIFVGFKKGDSEAQDTALQILKKASVEEEEDDKQE